MSFTGELYASFRRLWGIPATILAVILAIGTFFYVPTATVEWKYVIAGSAVVFLILSLLVDTSIRLYSRNRHPLPRVIRAFSAPPAYKTNFLLLLLEPSELFGQQALVSIFCLKDGCEILVAWGVTITIQEDKKVQVIIREVFEPFNIEFWNRVKNNDSTALEQLIIKPSLPANIAESLVP